MLRDRLGGREDRFFATVFLGSGLLFLAMLFFPAAAAGGIVIAFSTALVRLHILVGNLRAAPAGEPRAIGEREP